MHEHRRQAEYPVVHPPRWALRNYKKEMREISMDFQDVLLSETSKNKAVSMGRYLLCKQEE